jgi:hypothetical protein
MKKTVVVIVFALATALGVLSSIWFSHPSRSEAAANTGVAASQLTSGQAQHPSQDTAGGVTPLYTPDDPELPRFFTRTDSTYGKCIVTSNGLVSGCVRPSSEAARSGTVSIYDDVEGSGVPPFVFGQLSDGVKAVTIDVAGTEYSALVRSGFYLFRLPSTTQTVDAVKKVSFTLNDGSVITQRVSR